jgi:chromate transporter
MKKQESYFSIFTIFLKFGFLAWGGPVAQISMLKDELVDKKQWVSADKFRRSLAVFQALPGPEAHELCVYFGMIRAGRWGAILAGLGFMLPGFSLMLLISYAYLYFGAKIFLPIFVGVMPAVIAMIVRATYRMSTHNLTSQPLVIATFLSIIFSFLNVNFSLIFVLCAGWNFLWVSNYKKSALIFLTLFSILSFFSIKLNIISPFSMHFVDKNLFFEGLRSGMLSFGGAYTAIPFLQNSMVETYPAITQQTFLDGLALSAVIPAPLIIFGTFLGFISGGFIGATMITVGIFLPAFLFTLLGHNYLERLINNRAFHSTLDGIAAAVIGLLIFTSIHVFYNEINNLKSLMLFCSSLLVLSFFNSKWAIPLTILSSGLIGFVWFSVL